MVDQTFPNLIKPIFSVVIPLYNKERTIERAVKSVIEQTFTSWELLIVDDGSGDSGPQRAAKFNDHRITVITKQNGGVSSARNLGARTARGDWVALLDADDYWLPDHLEDLGTLIDRFPDVGVVTSSYEVESLNSRLRVTPLSIFNNGFAKLNWLQCQLIDDFRTIHSSSVAIKRRLWFEAGGFNERYQLGEDTEFWFRLGLLTHVALCERISAVYTISHNGSSSRDVLYCGDWNYAEIEEKLPKRFEKHYRQYKIRNQMKILALGTLLSGNVCLVRKMCKSGIFSPYSGRALVFFVLSFLPTAVLRYLYKNYRQALSKHPVRLVSITRDLEKDGQPKKLVCRSI